MQLICLVRPLDLDLNGDLSKAFEIMAYINRLLTDTENEKYITRCMTSIRISLITKLGSEYS